MTLGHQQAIIPKEMIDGWFGGLHNFLQDEIPDLEALIADPRRSFNADESGFPLCIKTDSFGWEGGEKRVSGNNIQRNTNHRYGVF